MSDTVVSVGTKGRIVIPADIRHELGTQEGSGLVPIVEGAAVVLVPRSAVKARLRLILAEVTTSLRDELLADRRAAAAHEAANA